MIKLRIKELLQERSQTQAELAESIGIARPNLSNIVSGKTSPSLATLENIANALEVEVADLFRPRDEFLAVVRENGKTMTFMKRVELEHHVESWKQQK